MWGGTRRRRWRASGELLFLAGALALTWGETLGGCKSSNNNGGEGDAGSSDVGFNGSTSSGVGSSGSTSSTGSSTGISSSSGSSTGSSTGISSSSSGSSSGGGPCVDPGGFCGSSTSGTCCPNSSYGVACNAYAPGQSICYISGNPLGQPFCQPSTGFTSCLLAADASVCCGDSVCSDAGGSCLQFDDAGNCTFQTGACYVTDGGYCDDNRPCAPGLTCYGSPFGPQDGGLPPPPGVDGGANPPTQWGNGIAGVCRPPCTSTGFLNPDGGIAFCCPGSTSTMGGPCTEGCSAPGSTCVLSSDCCSGNCTGGTCVGLPTGIACTFGDQCASFDCDPSIPNGDAGTCCSGVGNTQYGCVKTTDCCGGGGANPKVVCDQGVCCYPSGHGCPQGAAVDFTCCSGYCNLAGQCN
jgi:hypothetical protein